MEKEESELRGNDEERDERVRKLYADDFKISFTSWHTKTRMTQRSLKPFFNHTKHDALYTCSSQATGKKPSFNSAPKENTIPTPKRSFFQKEGSTNPEMSFLFQIRGQELVVPL